MATIQDFRDGAAGVHARCSEMRIQLVEDHSAPSEAALLVVDYPPPDSDPAGRDIWCDVIDKDWSVGSVISFKVKPDKPVRLSVSFLDRNRVAYTSWTDLTGGEWQIVRIRLDEIQPNPHFQPPGSDRDAPIDVSHVERIGFAPQNPEGGQFILGTLEIVD